MSSSPPEPTAAHVNAVKHAKNCNLIVVLYGVTGRFCDCGDDECKHQGKHPLPRKVVEGALRETLSLPPSAGNRIVTSDAAVVEKVFAAFPNANYGLVTGGKLVVIDEDPRKSGTIALAGLRERIGTWSDTREVKTQSDGRHHYFLSEDAERIGSSAGKVGPGIDVRAADGYVVGEGSVGVDGAYVVVRPGQPAPLPDAWRDHLLAVSPKIVRAAKCAGAVKRKPSASIAAKTTAYGQTALDAEVTAIRTAPASQRNAVLNQSAFRIGQLVAGGEIDEEQARAALLAAWIDRMRLAEERQEDAMSEQEGVRTIESGFAAGMQEPRASAVAPNVEPATSATNVVVEHQTDAGLAEHLVALYGARLRYVVPIGWHLWTEVRWEPDAQGRVTQLVVATARTLLRAATDKTDKDERKALIAFATRSESESRIRAALAIARTDPAVALAAARLDADPDVLNCRNGIVDLRTGALRPHDPTALCSKLVQVVYDPAAQAPRFMKFLGEVFLKDEAVIRFVQTAIGYSATGQTREQCLFIGHGGGANGKTTFMEAIRRAVGDYARNADFSTFTVGARTGGPRPDLVRLVGARMVTAQEGAETQRLNEALIKVLTGGDATTARDMYKSDFEFTPVLKPWLFSNHKPRITGDDLGIWRRVRLVPFLATFAADKQDKRLAETLAAEAPGILAWIVEGARRWYESGLPASPAIDEATKQYRGDEDVLGTFVADCCVTAPTTRVSSSVLYSHYKKWCDDAREDPLRDRDFKARFTERGFQWKKTNEGRFVLGLTLRVFLPQIPQSTSDAVTPVTAPSTTPQGDSSIGDSRWVTPPPATHPWGVGESGGANGSGTADGGAR